MSRIISISNHKGGVGKTTSTVNIGAALAQLGKKTLIVDLDPQANLSQSLGIMNPEKTIYGVLRGEYNLDPIEVNNNLYLVPANLDLSGAEIEMMSEPGREFILKEALNYMKGIFDYVLIDCPPSLGLLTINAFTASDSVIIPLQVQPLALHGFSKLSEVIGKIQQRLNKSLSIGGVFITQYDNRRRLDRDIAEVFSNQFKGNLFETKIREAISLAEAPTSGMDIFRYNPKSNGAIDYLDLAKEIIASIK